MRFLLYFAPFLLLIESLDNTSSNGITGNPVEVANKTEWERLNKIENELKHASENLNDVKQELITLEQIKPTRAKEDYLSRKVNREQNKYNELKDEIESSFKNVAEEAKNDETEPILQAKVKRSDKEFDKKVDVIGNQKEHEETSGKVKAEAIKSADEKNNEEEAKKDVGFPLWPIAIIVVVVVVVGGAFSIWKFVGRKMKMRRKGKKSTETDNNENTADLPKKLKPKISYDIDKMPRNTPEVVKKILAEDAKPGIPCEFAKSKTGKSDAVHFLSKCNLGSKVDMDGNHHCLYSALTYGTFGPLKVKEMHPLWHRNIYEHIIYTTPVTFTNQLEHSGRIRAYTYGPEPGAQIMEKINPEYAKNVENQVFLNLVRLLAKYSPNKAWPLFDCALMSCPNDVQNCISLISHHQYAFNGERAPFTSKSTRAIYELLDNVQAIFEKEPLLIEMCAPVAVIGDIHGQYNMLHYMFATQAKGDLPGWAACRWVLLGNYVDRGDQSLEVIVFLFLLKVLNPNSMCMLRGNHEDLKVNSTHGFGEELIDRFGEEDGTRLLERFNQVFEMMPLACIISGAVLCVHGGINQNMLSFDPWKINEELKPVQSNKWNDKKLFDIMWANPLENFTKGSARENVRKGRTSGERIESRDVYFGANDVKEMFERCGLQLLVRGHQRMMNGCKFGPGGHLILTVYSSNVTIEGKDYTNFAGTVFFTESGRIETTFLMRGLADEKQNEEVFMSRFNEHNDLVEYDVQCKVQPEWGTFEPPIHEPGTGNIPPSGDHSPPEYDMPDPIEPE